MVEPDLPRFPRPYRTVDIDQSVRTHGAAILAEVITPQLCERTCAQIDRWLDEHRGGSDADAGVSRGPDTLRVRSLHSTLSTVADVVGRPDLPSLARHILAALSPQVLLTAVEYLERAPGDGGRELEGMHRGTDAWPEVTIGLHPVSVHAIIALVPFTLDNGAMWLALGSQRLPLGELPEPGTVVRPIMTAGDAVLFRSDLIHGAGANPSGQRRRALSLGYRVEGLRHPGGAADEPHRGAAR